MKEFLAQQGVFHKIGMVRNSTSQAIVERFNGTLRRGLIHFKHWSKALQPVVSDYNNTYHSTIKMKPKEAHTNRIEEARTNIIERATKKEGHPLATCLARSWHAPATFRKFQ